MQRATIQAICIMLTLSRMISLLLTLVLPVPQTHVNSNDIILIA